jgi:formiminoglutamase
MTALHHDPHWPRAGAWLRGELTPAAPSGRLAVLGVPLAQGSITPGRCDLAPDAIRRALDRYSLYDFDGARDLRDLAVHDLGNLEVAAFKPSEAFSVVRNAVHSPIFDAAADALVLLGGDNSVTRPGVRAFGDVSLLTFDAHLDLRDTGPGLSNGNPVRALLEDGFPGSRIVQIGLQSFANSPAYAKVASDAGIRIITAEEVHAGGIDATVGDVLRSFTTDTVYVDFDIDVLDRAFAPGSPGSRPGGLLPWQLRRAARLCGLSERVRVVDIVEVDPTHDVADMTSLAAAACLLSFASGVLQRCSPSPTAPK